MDWLNVVATAKALHLIDESVITSLQDGSPWPPPPAFTSLCSPLLHLTRFGMAEVSKTPRQHFVSSCQDFGRGGWGMEGASVCGGCHCPSPRLEGVGFLWTLRERRQGFGAQQEASSVKRGSRRIINRQKEIISKFICWSAWALGGKTKQNESIPPESSNHKQTLTQAYCLNLYFLRCPA